MAAFLDGQNIFGFAVHVTELPVSSESQVNAFFGVNGVQSLFGGARGRTFLIEGVFVASVPVGIQSNRDVLDSFADGLTHVLTDTTGNSWTNVQYWNEFSWTGKYMPALNYGLWVRPYKLVMNGLT